MGRSVQLDLTGPRATATRPDEVPFCCCRVEFAEPIPCRRRTAPGQSYRSGSGQLLPLVSVRCVMAPRIRSRADNASGVPGAIADEK